MPETLAAAIRERIKTDQDIYVIRPPDLCRLWPKLEESGIIRQVRAFARKHGCRLHSYRRGIGAFIIKR
jgi:hypothetical protein